MRAPSFRVLALLLVLGGGCLGLCAGSLLAGGRGSPPPKSDPYMDGQVADYVRRFTLDAEGASLVRVELEQMRSVLRAKRNEIIARHQDELDAVSAATAENLRRILLEHGARPGPDAGGETEPGVSR